MCHFGIQFQGDQLAEWVERSQKESWKISDHANNCFRDTSAKESDFSFESQSSSSTQLLGHLQFSRVDTWAWRSKGIGVASAMMLPVQILQKPQNRVSP